jgi:hypothetical protein
LNSHFENELLDTVGSADPNPLNGEHPHAPSDDDSQSSYNESEPANDDS